MANIVPVNKEAHKNLKVSTKRDLSHVATQHIIPVHAREYAQAATSYPIVFIKEPDSKRKRSVAMLGLEAGENLYLSDNQWNAIYVPFSIAQAPFSLGLDPEKENTLTTYIDLESKFVGEDQEQDLFDSEGKETEFLKRAQESLGLIYDNEVLTEKFVQELEENDLLVELELNMNLSSGENKKLVGLYGIDEEKLQALSDEKVIDFHKRGMFIPIHAMLCSIQQINRLAQLRNLSDSPVKIGGIQFIKAGQDKK